MCVASEGADSPSNTNTLVEPADSLNLPFNLLSSVPQMCRRRFRCVLSSELICGDQQTLIQSVWTRTHTDEPRPKTETSHRLATRQQQQQTRLLRLPSSARLSLIGGAPVPRRGSPTPPLEGTSAPTRPSWAPQQPRTRSSPGQDPGSTLLSCLVVCTLGKLNSPPTNKHRPATSSGPSRTPAAERKWTLL